MITSPTRRGMLATAAALAAAVLASDPDSGRHAPPRFRAPLGALEDSRGRDRLLAELIDHFGAPAT